MPTVGDVLNESQGQFLLTKLLAGAESHGQLSEPDHETGDLIEIIRTCWDLLSFEQQQEVYKKHEELVTEWLGEEQIE